MQLGLLQARDGAEQVFYAAGIPGHRMSLELADIYDKIRLNDRSYDIERMVAERGRTADRDGRKILVQHKDIFELIHPAGAVDALHVFRRIRAAGAFSKRYVADAHGAQILRYRPDDRRMRRHRILRGLCHDKIRLEDNLHPRRELAADTMVFHDGANRSIDFFLRVIRNPVK